MNKKTLKLTGVLSGIALGIVGCTSLYSTKGYYSDVTDVALTPAVGTIPARVELEQAWDAETRMRFWFTSQGSRIMPYSWFAWLEQADSEELFRSAENMESLRYLPMPASQLNPAGLPIGFALDVDKESDVAWVGMTCSACHTNQLDYQDTKILIEGAPTLANFVKFYSDVVAALNATHEDDEKFERFARNVLKDEYSESRAEGLREQLAQLSLAASERQVVNNLPDDFPADFASYARLDAFGNIQNAGSAFALNDLSNRNPPSSPVSYPFIWGTHQSDVVQWNASAPNTPVVGPLVRNMGEVVGVFGDLKIKKAPWWQRLYGKKYRYSSTVDMEGLGHLESWVKTLRSPRWPEEYLPAIREGDAARGAQLFDANCKSCHNVVLPKDEGLKYIATQVPLDVVGTDPMMAWNAQHHRAKSLILEGSRDKIIFGDRFEEETAAIAIPVNGVVGVALRDPITAIKAGIMPMEVGEHEVDKTEEIRKSIEEYLKENLEKRTVMASDSSSPYLENGEKNLAGLVYKARPLNGIWATAPYLHNGSVPNLWELLQKPEDRVKQFWVGSRQFDPKHVGYKTNEGLNLFKVNNAQGEIQPGNSNLGHTWGTHLSEAEKWQLIEYLKTL
ncbi:di-heme-cytochrome C peroxidase [Aurantivibrio plasticivorans]